MPKEPKDTVNFRLGRSHKHALSRIAASQDRPMSEVVREAVEEYVAREERRAWEAEAERQSREIAEKARDPRSDEARTMEWIERVSEDMDWDK